ncbi:hypothetical protein ACLB2K_034889 [Fragaria x ananassa]
MEAVTKMVSERPVVIFSKSSCCISYSIKTLLSDFGVNPAVYELDEMQRGREIEQALLRLGCSPSVPAVFIGGEFVGGANEIMSLHLKRSLIPMLKRIVRTSSVLCRLTPATASLLPGRQHRLPGRFLSFQDWPTTSFPAGLKLWTKNTMIDQGWPENLSPASPGRREAVLEACAVVREGEKPSPA